MFWIFEPQWFFDLVTRGQQSAFYLSGGILITKGLNITDLLKYDLLLLINAQTPIMCHCDC